MKQENNILLDSGLAKPRRVISFMFIFMGLTMITALGQSTSGAAKKRLCIGPIIATKGTLQKVQKAGQADALQQALEALDTTLVDQANASRKFEIVARKAGLKTLLDEQDLGASGNIDPSTAAQTFKLAGAQYLVLTTLTDFMTGREELKFEGVGVSAGREAVRVSCSIQIYDTTTGKLIESARFRGQNSMVLRAGDSVAEGTSLTKITDRLAADILNHMIDVLYPAKITAKIGTQVTINRGEGTGVAVGQEWQVFALGETIVDPDTGESLGGNEAEVGRMKITRVTAKLSYGEMSTDNGVALGNVARPVPVSLPETPAPEDKNPSVGKDLVHKVDHDI